MLTHLKKKKIEYLGVLQPMLGIWLCSIFITGCKGTQERKSKEQILLLGLLFCHRGDLTR